MISIDAMTQADLVQLITNTQMLAGHAGVLRRAYETRLMKDAAIGLEA
jgi:hypothetical protein